MITAFFISLGSAVLSFMASFLPESSALPTGVTNAFSTIIEAINSLSYLIPVSALFTALGIVVAYEAAIWLFFGFMWIFKKIPVIGR